MPSIRTQLARWLLLGNFVLVATAGFTLEGVISGWLQRELDRGVLAKARLLASLTEQKPAGVEFESPERLMPEFGAEQRPEYYQIWVEQTPATARSSSLEDGDLPREAGTAPEPRFADIDLPDGRRGRMVQLSFEPELEDPDEAEEAEEEPDEELLPETALVAGAQPRHATIVLARGTDELREALAALHLILALAAGVLVIGTAGLTWFTLRRGLAPLDALGAQVRALRVESLSTRFRAEVPAELVPLIDQLNALLGRLEAAFERERRLTSDVAHELRTPVAELRSLAEVGSRWPDDRESVTQFFQDVQEVAVEMEGLIGNLLSLARIEAGLETISPSRVDVRELVDRVRSKLLPRAAERGITISLSAPSLVVETDSDKLAVVLENLLSNAVAHGPEGSEVHCRVDAGSRRLRVSNPAPDLRMDDIPHLFDRFWRKEGSRHGGSHSGIGLPLARTIVDLLGLALAAELEQGLLTMTLCFPEQVPEGAPSDPMVVAVGDGTGRGG